MPPRGAWRRIASVHEAPRDTAPPLFDRDEVEALLVDAARRGAALTYSDALHALGFGFSRPKMRALCKVLDAIDARAAARGEPELAVLVVRQSDGLPGQGWWVGRRDPDYHGPWEGPAAQAYIRAVQGHAFAFWAQR